MTSTEGAVSPPERKAGVPRNTHRSVVDVLARRIVDGDYAQGAQLPAVEILATEFSVSRTVIRETLRVLSAKGFIVSRQRAGTRVRPRSDWSLLDETVLRWLFAEALSPNSATACWRSAASFEPEAAALAATHGTGRNIAALEDAYNRMRTSLAAMDIEECCRADVDFHVALFAATGNVFLEQFAHIIRTALLITFETSTRLADSHAEAMSMHGHIVEDVRNRRPDKARADMVALLGIADAHLHRDGQSARKRPPPNKRD